MLFQATHCISETISTSQDRSGIATFNNFSCGFQFADSAICSLLDSLSTICSFLYLQVCCFSICSLIIFLSWFDHFS